MLSLNIHVDQHNNMSLGNVWWRIGEIEQLFNFQKWLKTYDSKGAQPTLNNMLEQTAHGL